MTDRQIEDIDSSLRILSYECDEMLVAKFNSNKLFDHYFLYSGVINYLKKIEWKTPEINVMISRFPRMVQPALYVFIPLLAYAVGMYFISSLLLVAGFVAGLLMSITLGFVLLKKQMNKDLIKAIVLCSELRMSLRKERIIDRRLN